MEIVLLPAVLCLAATNGANDNFKGVATLYGSRRAGYWTSLIWPVSRSWPVPCVRLFLRTHCWRPSLGQAWFRRRSRSELDERHFFALSEAGFEDGDILLAN